MQLALGVGWGGGRGRGEGGDITGRTPPTLSPVCGGPSLLPARGWDQKTPQPHQRKALGVQEI